MNSNESCLIVVVEDDECIRCALSDLLETEGYDVLAFNNGREALERLETCEKPCLILLDWMMPEMNGEQFLEARSRSVGRILRESPVVVVSAVAQLARRFPGVTELMSKPIDVEGLLRTVHRLSRPSPLAC